MRSSGRAGRWIESGALREPPERWRVFIFGRSTVAAAVSPEQNVYGDRYTLPCFLGQVFVLNRLFFCFVSRPPPEATHPLAGM